MSFIRPLNLHLEGLFSSGIFRPAMVQRDFQWSAENVGQILTDIRLAMHAGQTQYFLGPLVLRRDRDALFIYDGLQRMTALTIMLAVLRDTIGDAVLKDRLNQSVNTLRGQPRLILPHEGGALSQELQPEGEANKSRQTKKRETDSGRRIRESASALRKRVFQFDESDRAAIAEYLLRSTRIVALEVEDVDIARQIFVTTNARGVSLTEAEIFKGQLADLAAIDPHGEVIMQEWAEMEAKAGEHFGAFMVALDFLERREPMREGNLLKLADKLRAEQLHAAQEDKETGHLFLSQWVARALQRFEAWQMLQANSDMAREEHIAGEVFKLNLFKANLKNTALCEYWHPLAMQFLVRYRASDANNAKAILQRRLEGLARRAMAIELAGFEAGEQATIFGRALSQLQQNRDPINGALRLNERQTARVQNKLLSQSLPHEQLLTLLRWLEADMADPGNYTHIYNTSVEHVLPRNPKADSLWVMNAFPDVEARNAACHSLGNLCLLPYRLNKDVVGNDDYLKKRQQILAEAGKHGLDRFKLLPSIFDNMDWNWALITDRTEWMREQILIRLELVPTQS